MNYKEIRAKIEPDAGTQRLHWAVRTFRFLLGFLVLVVVVVLFYPSGDAQAAMEAKIEVLRRERDALKAERDAQLRKMEWIKTDDSYLEIAARDRLGLQKEGEFVIRFTAKDKAPGKADAAKK